MATQPATGTRPKEDSTIEAKLQKLLELYADAPELGRAALEKGLPESQA